MKIWSLWELPNSRKIHWAKSFTSSVKAVSDLLAPVSGTIVEVNESVLDDPGVINDDSMNNGWLVRIEMDSEKELANLLRAPDYRKLISK
jgi:glycine cleavage system H protein